jgi:peptidoglycan hydrolase-like protein with peptidoglycan-binding domain
MTFDLLSNPALIERFDPYFKHPDPDHHVLKLGDRAVACRNAKTALNKLGFRTLGDDPHLYDQSLSSAVKKFQQAVRHKNVDGAIGPGTRTRIVSELLRKSGASQFADLDASDRVLTVFLVRARKGISQAA